MLLSVLRKLRKRLCGRLLVYGTDSTSVAFMLNKRSSRSPEVAALMRRVERAEVAAQCRFVAVWVPRELNKTADALSKFELTPTDVVSSPCRYSVEPRW